MLASISLLGDSERCADLEGKLIVVTLILSLCVIMIFIFVHVEQIQINTCNRLRAGFLDLVYEKKISKEQVLKTIGTRLKELEAIPIVGVERKMIIQSSCSPSTKELGFEQDACIFCMHNLVDGEEADQVDSHILELDCKHAFHSNCAIEWFEKSFSCPVCRFSVRKQLMNAVYDGELF